ncbi:HAD family hydrolase [Povalibacter sp.]|uniref:HAD family hydrolase n=1 Tax=Povalibacter sp. TaxID=1962978 RepID=UPI002F42BBC1
MPPGFRDLVYSAMLQMLVCDLDGTLLMRGEPFAADDVQALHALGEQGVVRVIATGRALATARKVIPADFPIDYLVFSSGAGILDWRSQELLVSHTLQSHEAERAVQMFLAHELDFMIHAPIPAQHAFQFHRTGKPNPDFERRLARYAAEGRMFELSAARHPASQLLAVVPGGDPNEPFKTLRRELPELSVIRATSPLDGHSMWIEAFAAGVSKSQAAAWIARMRGLAREHTWAIGNDYNDWDLLRWAGSAAVVQGAPASMKAEFMSVDSMNSWLGRRE